MRGPISLALSGAIILAFSGLSAAAQQEPAPYIGEIVMDQSGVLHGAWVEKRTCDGEGVCFTLIMNTQTLEVARSNGRLTSPFEATGRGLEIQRAEPELDKARRLKAEAPQN